MSDAVVLTGATGFVGMEVLVRLLEHTDEEVIVLVRARDREAAAERLDDVLRRLYDHVPSVSARVQAIPADVSSSGLGLSASDRREIVARATSVVHCAGAIAFDLPLVQARNTNERGTARMLALARELSAAGRLRRMVHVSTAYVCGRRAGRFGEEDAAGSTFRNTYERSKANAETILRTSGGDLPIVVARPSIIVGDSRTGWTPNFNVVYWPLQALSRRLIREVPADPDGVVDIVPIDYVADGILALHQHNDADPALDTVHLVAGQRAVSNRRLLSLACEHFGLATPEFARRADLPGVREADLYSPYFDVHSRFDDVRSRSLLGSRGVTCPGLATYFSTLMSYAQRARWGKRSYTRQSTLSPHPHEDSVPRGRGDGGGDRNASTSTHACVSGRSTTMT